MREAVAAFVVLSLLSVSADAESIQVQFSGTVADLLVLPTSPPLDGSIQVGSAVTGVLQIVGIDSPGTPGSSPGELDYSLPGGLSAEVGNYHLGSAGLLYVQVYDDGFYVDATSVGGSIASSLSFGLAGDPWTGSSLSLANFPFDLSRWPLGQDFPYPGLYVDLAGSGGGYGGYMGVELESMRAIAPEPSVSSLLALAFAGGGLLLLRSRSSAATVEVDFVPICPDLRTSNDSSSS